MEHYKESSEYHGELREYTVGPFPTFFDEVTRMMPEKGLEVALPVFMKLRSYLVPLESTRQEATGLSLSIIYALKAEIQLPTREGVLTDNPI